MGGTASLTPRSAIGSSHRVKGARGEAIDRTFLPVLALDGFYFARTGCVAMTTKTASTKTNQKPKRATKVVELYDTTLRDGAQQEGISLSVEDKLAITQLLDDLGVDIVEGGYAGATPKDDEYFERVQQYEVAKCRDCGFRQHPPCGCRLCGRRIHASVAKFRCAPIATIVGKASEYQVSVVLETSVEENLAMISDSVSYLKSHGRRVIFDAEHFFDGFKENPDYAVRCLRSAFEAGAERLVLCDTNGGTLPHEIGEIVTAVKRELPEDAVLGIHSHNDTDTAVASAMEAFRAGVRSDSGLHQRLRGTHWQRESHQRDRQSQLEIRR